MSTNTIKLSSNTGDLYIAPQQTLSYKGINLFGYGYLDWGTILNQSIVNLIDKVDLLQDSGLSEIKFDLTEYEEEQKRLRIQEFQLWKTGFTDQLKALIETFNDSLQEQIVGILNDQKIINESVSNLIASNYEELRTDLNNLTQNLDERILELVNNQLKSIIIKLDDLTDIVDSTKFSLEQATSSLNETKIQTEQNIKNFKEEFLITFEKFKNDTNKALNDNKEFLIRYINEALAKVEAITNIFEKRLLALETLSGSLDATSIQQMIINRVNELTEAIILARLQTFDNRVSDIEDILINLEGSVDQKIANSIQPLKTEYSAKFKSIDTSIINLNDKTAKATNDLIPLNKLMAESFKHFETPEEPIINIVENQEMIGILSSYTNGISQNYKDLVKNILESLLNQIKFNQEQLITVENDLLKNLLDGLKNSSFNELSILKRNDSKKLLETSSFNKIKNTLTKYNPEEFKFTYLMEEIKDNSIYFAFKLPYSADINLWKESGIKIKNLTTLEEIELHYQIADSYFNLKDISYLGENLIIPSGLNYSPFIYYYYNNSSQLTKIKFSSLLETDKLEFSFYKDGLFKSKILTKILDLKYLRDDSLVSQEFIENLYIPDLSINENINIPSINLQTLTHTTDNNKIEIPISKIVTNNSGNKEFSIKINLPKTSTLTKIDFNDGYTDQTKIFTNQSVFPKTEAEYNSRNLDSTNNYYTDIGTTGVLYFPINSNSKFIRGTITYVLNGVTKTEEISGSNGGNILSEIIEITMGSGKFVDIDAKTYFGSNIDGRKLLVDIKAYDNEINSDTYQMWMNGNNITSVGIKQNGMIRVYNEFSKTLKFLITIMEHKGNINGYATIA